jgi:hypothetical protein
MIAAADAAVKVLPTDAQRQYWLAVFRWRSISRDVDERGRVITTAFTRDIAGRIAKDFLVVPTLCSSTYRPWWMAARINLEVLNDPAGYEQARQARRRAPHNPSLEALLATELDDRAAEQDE